MDLNQYAVFLLAVDSGSLTTAAEQSGYTQSGVSHMIKRLEAELGFPLLHRLRNGVKPTRDAERIIPILRDLLSRSEQLDQIVSSVQGVKSGTLRIGTVASVSAHWLPRILKIFNDDYPRIAVQLFEGGDHEIPQWIREGKVDFAFCNYQDFGNLEWRPLVDDQLVAILPLDHPLADAEVFPMEALNGAPFIMLPVEYHYETQQLFERYALKPDVRYSVVSDLTTIAMVEQGLGVSVTSELMLKGYLPRRLAALELEPPCPRKLGILLPSLRDASPAAKMFIAYAEPIILGKK